MKKIKITVDLDAVVPNDTTQEELDQLTLDIPVAGIILNGPSGPIEEARVRGFVTIHTEVPEP